MTDEQLHNYTEAVIELWTAYQHKKFNLSDIGGKHGLDSRYGIDRIALEAEEFLGKVKSAEDEGYWWDGGWIDAVWCWSKWAVNRFMDIDQKYDVKDFMESPDTNPDKEI